MAPESRPGPNPLPCPTAAPSRLQELQPNETSRFHSAYWFFPLIVTKVFFALIASCQHSFRHAGLYTARPAFASSFLLQRLPQLPQINQFVSDLYLQDILRKALQPELEIPGLGNKRCRQKWLVLPRSVFGLLASIARTNFPVTFNPILQLGSFQYMLDDRR